MPTEKLIVSVKTDGVVDPGVPIVRTLSHNVFQRFDYPVQTTGDSVWPDTDAMRPLMKTAGGAGAQGFDTAEFFCAENLEGKTALKMNTNDYSDASTDYGYILLGQGGIVLIHNCTLAGLAGAGSEITVKGIGSATGNRIRGVVGGS